MFASAITAVWLVSNVVSLLMVDYQPPAGLHSLMLAVAGWAFGKPVADSIRRRDGRDDGAE